MSLTRQEWADLAAAVARVHGVPAGATTLAMVNDIVERGLDSEGIETIVDVAASLSPGYPLALHVLSVVRPRRAVELGVAGLLLGSALDDAAVGWWLVLRASVRGRDLADLQDAFVQVAPARRHLVAGALAKLVQDDEVDEVVEGRIREMLRSSSETHVRQVLQDLLGDA